MALSDKIKCTKHTVSKTCEWVYLEKDVKEFIKELKEKISNSQLGWEGHLPEDKRIAEEVNKMIDKLAGEKLI